MVTAVGGGLAALVSRVGFRLALSSVASAEASEVLASMQGYDRSCSRIRGVGRTLVEPPVEAELESPGRTPELQPGSLGTGALATVEAVDRDRANPEENPGGKPS